MNVDIREKENIAHEDIIALNFIKKPCPYFFRKHFREGLRSRLLQVLDPKDVENETTGVVRDGLRLFPAARPLSILRIFKKRFQTARDIQKEIDRYKILKQYLPASHYAPSVEFIVDYIHPGNKNILLCGFQEYVEGESIDPWRSHGLLRLEAEMAGKKRSMIVEIKRNIASFVRHMRNMIQKTGFIPDLAGAGNILITPSGEVKLVDINNVSELSFDTAIYTDDKGYPVSDKSVEALLRLEQSILGRSVDVKDDPLYRFFLDPMRIKRVKSIESAFLEASNSVGNYPAIKPLDYS